MSKQSIENILQEIQNSQKEDSRLNKDYRKRLDEHILIYEKNGQTLELLAKGIEEMKKKQDAMYKVYLGFNWSTKAIMWVLGLVAAIFGVILTYKEIFGK